MPEKGENAMNILNLYFSSTGNTKKVALRIEKAIRGLQDIEERVKGVLKI